MDDMDLAFYRHQGHLTVNGVFAPQQMDAVIRDIEQWGETFLAELPPEKRAWFIDGGVSARTVLRKLDNPHFHRDAVQALARDPKLVGLVEQFLGKGVSVYFSQIFFKPPEGGGPKPAHQDNFYFGPSDIEGVVTIPPEYAQEHVRLGYAATEHGILVANVPDTFVIEVADSRMPVPVW